MEQKFKKLAAFAKGIGLDHFLLGIKQENMITFHYENMPIKAAMEMMIMGFHQVIDMELQRHPEYSDDYVKIFRDLDSKFNDLVKEADGKFIAFQQRKKK